MKGKALRRALETNDVVRINSDLPLITDTTELITPHQAEEMLTRNQHNRPINWNQVEKYAELMSSGEWKLQPQGIILDPSGNILTGQTRLWGIVYSGCTIAMRVSRGCPADRSNVIDRGRPQSSRDLSTRMTQRKHSPAEVSLARCVAVLRGFQKPSTDTIAAILIEKNVIFQRILKEIIGARKDKAILMMMGAAAAHIEKESEILSIVSKARELADRLERELLPYTVNSCWGRGVSFGMALKKAQNILEVKR